MSVADRLYGVPRVSQASVGNMLEPTRAVSGVGTQNASHCTTERPICFQRPGAQREAGKGGIWHDSIATY